MPTSGGERAALVGGEVPGGRILADHTAESAGAVVGAVRKEGGIYPPTNIESPPPASKLYV